MKVKINWNILDIIDPLPPRILILAADVFSTVYASVSIIIGIVIGFSPYFIETFAPPYICCILSKDG